MPRKGYTPEQIIGKLCEVDVLVQQEQGCTGGSEEDRGV